MSRADGESGSATPDYSRLDRWPKPSSSLRIKSQATALQTLWLQKVPRDRAQELRYNDDDQNQPGNGLTAPNYMLTRTLSIKERSFLADSGFGALRRCPIDPVSPLQ